MAGPGEIQRRRRMYEFLYSAADLDPGCARRWRKAAREMRGADAGVMSRVRDYATGCKEWIAMEIGTKSKKVAAARKLVLEWGRVCAAEGTAEEYAAFWTSYVAFELRHGDAERVRAVAVDAAKACPRHAAVRAMCAVAERRLDD